jgi:hypothetical protein
MRIFSLTLQGQRLSPQHANSWLAVFADHAAYVCAAVAVVREKFLVV